MEDKFTKLNLNGVEKYVSAVYDGSGNNITDTYETKTDAADKKTALSKDITDVNGALNSLTERVKTIEGFAEDIKGNKNNIQTNLAAIQALQQADITFQNDLETLTIKVGENSGNVEKLTQTTGNLSISVLSLDNTVDTLNALVTDEASGINALNKQADDNTANIAKVDENLRKVQADLDKKVNAEVFTPVSTKVSEYENTIASLQEQINALLARIVALETPSDSPEEEPEVEPTDPEVAPEGAA